ncbi:siroheme synthase CysG [Nevskia ramosa]|uniref:siroheme synthase CysG n=1 Tax=Nevskia ramosa TaxID=64002 RepID=UPI0023569F28|nr:siroheme synthase CysG [Nevskia ramosa]
MSQKPDAAGSPPKYFPITLRLDDARVLVVGGGEIAARKLRLLLKAGPRAEVVARELNPELAALCAIGTIIHLATEFDVAQLAGARLVIAATDDKALNRLVAAEATARGILVNAVDDPEPSTFITPAIIERPPLTIAIATGGAAPVVARRLRERIEAELPQNYGALAEFTQSRRDRVKAALEGPARRVLWERFLDSPGAEAVLRGDEAAADAVLETLLADQRPLGEVYLVGAGPGDPDLLTFRALRLMQQADVVLYDRLIGAGILELVRRDAERIFVGKRRNQHTVPQDEINEELVRLAKQGKRVLRLKGGDPFVFGRGGEEIERLAAAGIPFQVVPGITAASGCSTYAGIPLTHRDYAQACIFVTGHPRADGQLTLPWDALARPGQTIAIYMGLGSLAMLCAKLVEHGLPADWPAALIEEGTSANQRVIASTLGKLPGEVTAAEVKGASLVIVGEVVKLRERLAWR